MYIYILNQFKNVAQSVMMSIRTTQWFWRPKTNSKNEIFYLKFFLIFFMQNYLLNYYK